MITPAEKRARQRERMARWRTRQRGGLPARPRGRPRKDGQSIVSDGKQHCRICKAVIDGSGLCDCV